jgi:hypothetical protein
MTEQVSLEPLSMVGTIDELELAALRSGRDEYSNMKLPALAVAKAGMGRRGYGISAGPRRKCVRF